MAREIRLSPGVPMIIVQLTGYVAFIAASLYLGVRLLRLARRTRETAELSLGLAFLLSGGFGYIFWLALVAALILGVDPRWTKALTIAGLVPTIVGAVANGVGVANVFRTGRTWPYLLIGGLSLAMAGLWIVLMGASADTVSMVFWYILLLSGLIYLWGSVEALVVARQLHRRARLGMADPEVVNRAAQWSLASAAVVLMIAIGFAARLVFGRTPPPSISTVTSLLGVVAAVAIWLGFFPPAAYRARLARAYGG